MGIVAAIIAVGSEINIKLYIAGKIEKNIEYFFMSVDAYSFENNVFDFEGTETKTTVSVPTDSVNTEPESVLPTPAATFAETEANTEQNTEESSSVGEEQTENMSQSIVDAAAAVIPMENLLDYNYVLKNFYVVPDVTELSKERLKLEEIAALNLSIEKDSSAPQILIFHTHGQEAFADSNTTGKTIVDVGDYLTRLLTEEYGYNVMHMTDSFDLVNGVFDRSEAYTYANKKLDEVLAMYPSIQVVIDLHRDGVPENVHHVTEINGKPTAKIMLFNGISYTKEQGDIEYLYNPFLKENLALTYQMYLLGEMLYPDFIRCIYISGYRYCLYHVPRSMLIEAGAQTNTYEEMINAMEPLAQMLDKQFGGL